MRVSVCIRHYTPFLITVAPWIADGWSVFGNYVYKNFETAVDYYTAQTQCGVKRGNLAAEVLRHSEVIR